MKDSRGAGGPPVTISTSSPRPSTGWSRTTTTDITTASSTVTHQGHDGKRK
ncbi:hypothetical protein [Streptosporangium sp. LJ11]|uniref:hypothetical protein n=1 Tax=Streptosporangium sp. LJ11 TaxID=3436927 RepID=UPI003F7B2628